MKEKGGHVAVCGWHSSLEPLWAQGPTRSSQTPGKPLWRGHVAAFDPRLQIQPVTELEEQAAVRRGVAVGNGGSPPPFPSPPQAQRLCCIPPELVCEHERKACC